MTIKDLTDCKFVLIHAGEKRPRGNDWQRNSLAWEDVANEPAYGILTGHGGFLAVDCDSPMAIVKLADLFGDDIPDTWSWTSGKEGRMQFGFFVPENLRDKLSQARYWEKMPDGGQLDFRWKGCQSVLPPSPHPETDGYFWELSPQDTDLAIAPEWLIDYAVSLKNRKIKRIRFPCEAYKHFGASSKIWVLLQLYAGGSGRADFSLQKAANHLSLSISRIKTLLTEAYRKGLIRNKYWMGDRCVAYPTAMLKIALLAGLENLGTVTEVSRDEIKNLNTKCTEAIACAQQRQSLWAAQKANKQKPENQRQHLTNFFKPAETGTRVLWSDNDRFTAVSEGALVYGASQEAIARSRGTCTKTVQRHLDNNYRSTPSPIHGRRMELGKIQKTQILQRIPKRMNFVADFSEVEDGGHYLKCGDRVYACRPNIYHQLASPVRIRAHRKKFTILRKNIEKIAPEPEKEKNIP